MHSTVANGIKYQTSLPDHPGLRQLVLVPSLTCSAFTLLLGKQRGWELLQDIPAVSTTANPAVVWFPAVVLCMCGGTESARDTACGEGR